MKKYFLFFLLFSFVSLYSKGMPPEFYKLRDSKKQKEFFLNHLFKLVVLENNKILSERNLVKSILNSNILNINFNSADFTELIKIKNKYKIKNIFSPLEYIKKIDIVPPSMALAQAAVESGWGKSRFIKEANNIFGHWTYDPSNGMLPENRDEGATHFIRVFKSLDDSISAYMLNLNRNLAYKEFREIRYNLRQSNQKIDGLILSQTMINYSGIAHEYLSMLKTVINQNNLLDYDTKYYTNLNSN